MLTPTQLERFENLPAFESCKAKHNSAIRRRRFVRRIKLINQWRRFLNLV